MTIPANWKADHNAHAGALAFAGARPLTNWHNVTPEVAAQDFPCFDLTDLLDFGQLGVERGTLAAALTVFLQTLAHQSDRQICWCPVHQISLSQFAGFDAFERSERNPRSVPNQTGEFRNVSGS